MDRSRQFERIQKITLGLLAAFLAVAVMLSYWGVARGEALAQRQDNPRRVEAELRIRRGRILDSDGQVLAQTTGPVEAPQRVYPLGMSGPAVGYYSFRFGTAGVEEGFDAVLRGESANVWDTFWRHNLHEAQQGRDIRLTLNGDRQRVAEALLGIRRGAVVLLTLPDGAISAMVSHPGYDPNRLDEQFDALVDDPTAPLFNRATQGQYQPGLVLQPFYLAGALDRGVIALDDLVGDAVRAVEIQGQSLACTAAPPESATWQDVLRNACPGPLLRLAEELDASEIGAILSAFRLTVAPELPLAVAEPPELTLTDLPDLLIGQGELTVSPLQLVLAFAALANEGAVPAPRLVSAIAGQSGDWQNAPFADAGQEAVGAAAAAQVLRSLPQHGGAIVEFAAQALAGPEGSSNAWYLGLAPTQEPRFAVVVVVEDSAGSHTAASVGRALLNRVLAEGD
jgi:peptidoglycan glycosyltransferase